jgi:uncharacterized pyridoxal phosphate-containing UPF0001 family protein
VLSPAELRERYELLREQVGPAVTIVAATKYVTVEEMAGLVEAGIEVVGENRAQDLQAKHAVYGDAFRWHFIGRLQSNKAKVVNRCCELVHSLDSHATGRRLEVPALVQVNLAGEESKGGVSPAEVGEYLGYGGRRAFRDAPGNGRPRGVARVVPAAAELAAEHGLRELSMGTTGLRRAADEGATHVRVGSVLFDRNCFAARS